MFHSALKASFCIKSIIKSYSLQVKAHLWICAEAWGGIPRWGLNRANKALWTVIGVKGCPWRYAWNLLTQIHQQALPFQLGKYFFSAFDSVREAKPIGFLDPCANTAPIPYPNASHDKTISSIGSVCTSTWQGVRSLLEVKNASFCCFFHSHLVDARRSAYKGAKIVDKFGRNFE